MWMWQLFFSLMIISSWNVNSIRVRLNHIIEYLKKNKPRFLLLQEIKTENKNFPYSELKAIGYDSEVHGQKSYNGVAIIYNDKISNVNFNVINDKQEQSRTISVDINYKNELIKIISVYVPNGNPVDTDKYQYKLKWLKSLEEFLINQNKLKKKIIIGGDFNIIPNEEDVYNPEDWENDALYRIEIRKFFRNILNEGYEDAFRLVNKQPYNYTFWDYQYGSFEKNKGLRIDHFLLSKNISHLVKDVTIDKYTRALERPSDHAPIKLTLF
jgi:exodeoxyribonuclease-3